LPLKKNLSKDVTIDAKSSAKESSDVANTNGALPINAKNSINFSEYANID